MREVGVWLILSKWLLRMMNEVSFFIVLVSYSWLMMFAKGDQFQRLSLAAHHLRTEMKLLISVLHPILLYGRKNNLLSLVIL